MQCSDCSVHKNIDVNLILIIGFVSKLNLFSAGPSIMFTDEINVSIEIPDSQPVYSFNKLTWNNEITLDEAVIKLEKTLYPFKEVSLIPCNICECPVSVLIFHMDGRGETSIGQ